MRLTTATSWSASSRQRRKACCFCTKPSSTHHCCRSRSSSFACRVRASPVSCTLGRMTELPSRLRQPLTLQRLKSSTRCSISSVLDLNRFVQGLSLKVMDCRGDEKTWRKVWTEIHALVFVVDASNHSQVEEASNQLGRVLG